MSSASRRIQRHRKSRDKLSRLTSNSDHVQVIHYSCESFYNRIDERSPRITSIAVRNFGTGSTRSFSIHQVAEVRKLRGGQLEESYDSLEREMLDEYFEFMRSHLSDIWLHWNMRDIIFGFQALEQRYKVLGGQPTILAEANKVDLSELLTDIYGSNYIGQPRLASLVQKNDLTNKDFLPGEEEAVAFQNREYFKMHLSTLRKVHILSQSASLAEESRLKTDMSWGDIYSINPESIGEFLKDHWLVSTVTFLATLLGLVLTLFQ